MTHLLKHASQTADAALEICDISVSTVRDTVLDIAEDLTTCRERAVEASRIAGNELYGWTLDLLADAKAARLYRNEVEFGYQPDSFDARVNARLYKMRQDAQKK